MLARKKTDLTPMEACVQSAFARREPQRDLPSEMAALLQQLQKQDGKSRMAW